jgi:hypothetical protein
MSLFPHRCTECGKRFRYGGHGHGSLYYTLYRCDQCFKKLDEENKKQGYPGLEPSEDEMIAYRRKVHDGNEQKKWADLEKEERIKARVWNEEKRRAQLEKEE